MLKQREVSTDSLLFAIQPTTLQMLLITMNSGRHLPEIPAKSINYVTLTVAIALADLEEVAGRVDLD